MPATAGGAAPRGVAPRGVAPRDTALQRARRAPAYLLVMRQVLWFRCSLSRRGHASRGRQGARDPNTGAPRRRTRGTLPTRPEPRTARAAGPRGPAPRVRAVLRPPLRRGQQPPAASKQRPPNGSTCRTYQVKVGKRIFTSEEDLVNSGINSCPFLLVIISNCQIEFQFQSETSRAPSFF
jgi:hypothetical protein